MPEPAETRFLADRMLGTLTRYLRFMGYDTVSANGFGTGTPDEDTCLLSLAAREHRILLTRDHELARRGGEQAVLVVAGDVLAQVRQLADLGLVEHRLPMSRCSLCNTVLRGATEDEIASARYAPHNQESYTFFWCDRCGKLYWNGSHGRRLQERIASRLSS
ncbi:Mut7-C RNAse domain-containing protein [Methanoregula sp.]|uniref:Mut7-C RNAse domain-containing protein n=1 Tax=Methanoregula sp. TaxID=2052170 RepID=UPI002BC0B767|nr:Mut7-C RNAse domain-containing protein [Methanoregula sp.]HVP96866.1 Mut7-C RNAse domain-containing protein [Methanoregula sp.]